MRIALCQTWMETSIDQNLGKIQSCVEKAAKMSADLVVFPECALTAYHRGLPNLLNTVSLEPYYTRILDLARQHKIAILVGSPKLENEAIYNAALLAAAPYEQCLWGAKNGLTDSEKRFFTAAQTRATFSYQGKKIGMVFCREILDLEHLIQDFESEEIDFICWLSYIQWHPTPDFKLEDHLDRDYIKQALECSKCLQIPVINVNAANSLNAPELCNLGGSLLINNGEIHAQSKLDKEEIVYIDLDLLGA